MNSMNSLDIHSRYTDSNVHLSIFGGARSSPRQTPFFRADALSKQVYSILRQRDYHARWSERLESGSQCCVMTAIMSSVSLCVLLPLSVLCLLASRDLAGPSKEEVYTSLGVAVAVEVVSCMLLCILGTLGERHRDRFHELQANLRDARTQLARAVQDLSEEEFGQLVEDALGTAVYLFDGLHVEDPKVQLAVRRLVDRGRLHELDGLSQELLTTIYLTVGDQYMDQLDRNAEQFVNDLVHSAHPEIVLGLLGASARGMSTDVPEALTRYFSDNQAITRLATQFMLMLPHRITLPHFVPALEQGRSAGISLAIYRNGFV